MTSPTPAPMVAFPERLPFDTYDDEIDYERALRLAWEQRARLAVEALNEIACLSDRRAHERLRISGSYAGFDEPGSVGDALKALALIGPLPSPAAQE